MSDVGMLVIGVLILSIIIYIIKELYLIFTQKSLKDEVAFITGGAQGLGKILALKLAKEGCHVAIADVNPAHIEETVKEVQSLGVRCKGYEVDITQHLKVYEVAKQVKNDIGLVTILINNAGITTNKKLFESDESLIRKVMEVNALSHFWTIKAFVPSMMENNHGHIVAISSYAGIIGAPGMADYSASKFSVFGLTESLRLELRLLGKLNVHTLTVMPFFMKTSMFPDARATRILPVLDPDMVGDKIIRAIRRKEGTIIIPAIGYTTFLVRLLFPIWIQDKVAIWLGAGENYDVNVKSKKD